MKTAGNEAPGVDYQERFFNAQDGIRLFFRRWFLAEPKGLVALVHGFAEHCGRYDELASVLGRAGWSVAAMDYRGHGQSGGRRAHIDRFDEYLDDVQAFLDETRRDGFEGKPVLLGHSQGGLIAARFAELFPEKISRLVLSSPFFGLAMKVPAPKAWLGKAVSKWLPTFSMPTGVDPGWLSHDSKVAEAYAADPLVGHHATARWFTEVTRAQDDALCEAGRLQIPLLVLLAGDDKLASVETTRRFYEAAGSADKQIEIYRDYYHEIFNEVGRDHVFDDLTAWLEKPT